MAALVASVRSLTHLRVRSLTYSATALPSNARRADSRFDDRRR
jgi:hypothetical protein